MGDEICERLPGCKIWIKASGKFVSLMVGSGEGVSVGGMGVKTIGARGVPSLVITTSGKVLAAVDRTVGVIGAVVTTGSAVNTEAGGVKTSSGDSVAFAQPPRPSKSVRAMKSMVRVGFKSDSFIPCKGTVNCLELIDLTIF